MSKIVALVMVLSIALSTSVFAYGDVETHWAKDEITKWSEMEILKGADDVFRPNEPIKRGEMAVILDRVMGYELTAYNTFADLNEAFYTKAMLGANASGIILGSDNKIRPQDAITREEATVMLCRALGLNTSIITNDIKFADNGEIAAWAMPSVYAMANGGYVKGNPDGTFSPKGNITRGEVVKILDNTIKKLQTKAGAVTQTVSGNMVINTTGVMLKDMTIQGDLILAEGIESGEVTLTNVVVAGTTIVRGGGENSIIVDGKSSLGPVIIERIAGSVAVKVAKEASVVSINVQSNGAKITAPSTRVMVGEKVTGTIVNGKAAAGGAIITGETATTGGGGGSSNPSQGNQDAQNFKETHKAALELSIYVVTKEDKPKVEAAQKAYEALSDGTKTQLASEKHLLDSLLAWIILQEQEEPGVNNPAVGGDKEYIPTDEV